MKKFKKPYKKWSYSRSGLRSVILFFIGLVAFFWFLVRVVPKPSRAAYPCMQAAFPFATAFVLWLTGVLSSSLLFVKARATWYRSKYILAFVFILMASFIFLFTSTSIKFTPVIARAYIFTNNLIGNALPVMQNIAEKDSSVVEPIAVIGSAKSFQAIAEDIDYTEILSMVSLAIERAGGLEGIVSDGDTVILKPNIVVSSDGTAAGQQLNPEVNGVTTDYRVMQAVASIINEINPSGVIYILEGSATGSTANNMTILNYDQISGIDSLICLEDACQIWGDTACINLQGISLPPDKVLYEGADNRYWLHKLYYQADVVISMPVLKNHVYAGTTGSVKNVGIGAAATTIYGNYPGYPTNMRWYIDHNDPPRTNLHYWIHDFFMCRPVDFVVMDGLQGIQNGPVGHSNTPQLSDEQMNMRLILASKDPLAVDAVGALLTGHDPELIPHLVTLHNDSMGCCDARFIRVSGIKVGDEKNDFEITDTGLLSKYDDFEPPSFSINDCFVIGNQLHFSLSVDEEVTKVEIRIDGIYLNQIVINDFDNFSINLGTLEVNPETEIIVYAYDQYLNYSAADASGMISTTENVLFTERFEVFPNPCSGLVNLRITISDPGYVIFGLFDITGLKIKSFINEKKLPGNYEMEVDLSDLPTGIYFCVLRTNDGVKSKKLVKL